MLRLISSAELEMHRVASASLPVASPFESSFSEHRNHGCVHVAGCSLLIRLRIQINSDAHAWVESLVPVRCGRNEKHPPKLVILFRNPLP